MVCTNKYRESPGFALVADAYPSISWLVAGLTKRQSASPGLVFSSWIGLEGRPSKCVSARNGSDGSFGDADLGARAADRSRWATGSADASDERRLNAGALPSGSSTAPPQVRLAHPPAANKESNAIEKEIARSSP